jgi:hypothetical protein
MQRKRTEETKLIRVEIIIKNIQTILIIIIIHHHLYLSVSITNDSTSVFLVFFYFILISYNLYSNAFINIIIGIIIIIEPAIKRWERENKETN